MSCTRATSTASFRATASRTCFIVDAAETVTRNCGFCPSGAVAGSRSTSTQSLDTAPPGATTGERPAAAEDSGKAVETEEPKPGPEPMRVRPTPTAGGVTLGAGPRTV